MKRWELINRLIKKHGYTRYLEIGVDKGYNFNQVKCKYKDSVDPGHDNGKSSHGGDGKFKFDVKYRMTSDMFFERVNVEPYDIIFIDGLHHDDQCSKDIENSLKNLKKGGTIILHDCNPRSEESQIIPRQTGYWHGNIWQSVVRYRHKKHFGCIVIDDDCGLGVIREDIPQGESFELPEELTYSWLDENRHKSLQLVSVEEGEKILEL